MRNGGGIGSRSGIAGNEDKVGVFEVKSVKNQWGTQMIKSE